MRGLPTILLISILASVALNGCNENRMATAMNFKQSGTQDTLINLNSNSLSDLKENRIRRRITNNITSIRLRLETLDQSFADSISISSQARITSEQLRKDLVRLEQDLESRLETLESNNNSSDATNVTNGLEKIEDELAQIKEEIDEWVELNYE